MKKGKLNFIKVKFLLPFFALMFAATVPIRIYQYFTVIAPGTGFYTSLNWAVYALYGILAFASIVFILSALLSAEAVQSKMPVGKSKALAIVSYLFSVCFIIDAVKQISAFVIAFIGYSSGAVKPGFWSYVTSNGYIPVIMEAFFALCAGVYMIVFGMSYSNGKNTFEDSKLLALGPMLWSVSRLIAGLMQPISYQKVSELLLELFALAFLMIAFLSFARVSSQLSEEGEMRKVFAFGYPAALFCLVCAVPRLVLFLIGQSSMLSDGHGVDLTLLMAAAFLLTYIGTAMYLGNKELPEDLQEQADNEQIDDNFLSED